MKKFNLLMLIPFFVVFFSMLHEDVRFGQCCPHSCIVHCPRCLLDPLLSLAKHALCFGVLLFVSLSSGRFKQKLDSLDGVQKP